ncbi:LptF/LptG family permease [Psittacicella hinzii]|uniref:Lipopolysaccharide export system permease protein n=1 Tax=Psittacicella hinzii TaxID=2028575 RepID=A0A3A1YRF7_9GAMM|nr:LptF/LptG family permease [Psittacicella hinzii]RIY39829.1 hypothetical protein CKF58_01565 [Psittacicella hinzii]
MVFFRILDRYIVKKVSITVAFTLLGLVVFSLIIRITEELSHVGKEAYTLADAIIYSICLAAPDINTFFPMAGLLGAMIALGQLAGNSELIIMQSVGVSRLRIFLGLLWFIVPFSLFNLAIQQWVSPQVTSYAYTMKNSKLKNGNFFRQNETLWSKTNGEFIYAKIGANAKLTNIFVLQYDEQTYNLARILISDNASWDEQDKKWIMHQAQVYSLEKDDTVTFNQEEKDKIQQNLEQANINANVVWPLLSQELADQHNFTVKLYSDYYWKTDLTPDKLSLVNQDTNNYTLTSLYSYINFLDETNQNSNSFKYLFWSKILSGFSFFVMMYVATANIFGNVRNVSMLVKIFYAVILGLIFFILNNTVGPFLMNYGIPAIVAALMPSMIFMIYGFYLSKRK